MLALTSYTFTSAQVCNSAYFNGVNDGIKIECPLVANEPTGWSLQEFTYDFWVKAEQSDDAQYVFSFRGKDDVGYGCHANRGYIIANGFF